MPHAGRGSHTGGVGRREAGGGFVEDLSAGIEDRRDWIRSLGCASHSPASFLETALKEKHAYLEAELKRAPRPRPQSAKARLIRDQQEQLGVIVEVFRDTGKLSVYRDSLRRGYSKEAAGRAACALTPSSRSDCAPTAHDGAQARRRRKAAWQWQ